MGKAVKASAAFDSEATVSVRHNSHLERNPEEDAESSQNVRTRASESADESDREDGSVNETVHQNDPNCLRF